MDKKLMKRMVGIAIPMALIITGINYGLCDFSNFFMNEMLGYDYELLKCDRMIRILFTVLYLFIGIYMMRSSNTSQKEEI